jgi:hypothetical protein
MVPTLPSSPSNTVPPAAFILLLIPVLVVYLPFWLVSKLSSRRAAHETALPPQKWLSLSLALLLGAGLYLTLADLARLVLNYYWSGENLSVYSYDSFVKSVSARMVVVLLGFPLLAGVWYKTTNKDKNAAQEKSEVLTRKYALSVEALLLGTIAIVFLGICLYQVFNWTLGVSVVDWSSLSPAVGYGGVALIFLAVKLFWLKTLKTSDN